MRELLSQIVHVAAVWALRDNRRFQAIVADAELAAEYAREVVDLRQQVETLSRMLGHAERKVAHWKRLAGGLGVDTEGLSH